MDKIEDWLLPGEGIKEAVMKCVRMDEENVVDASIVVKEHILWSGGAADCIIFAAVNRAKKYAIMTHKTRIGGKDGKTIVGLLRASMPQKVKHDVNTNYFIATSCLDTLNKQVCQDMKEELERLDMKNVKLLNSSKLLIDAISGKYSIDFNTDELPK